MHANSIILKHIAVKRQDITEINNVVESYKSYGLSYRLYSNQPYSFNSSILAGRQVTGVAQKVGK